MPHIATSACEDEDRLAVVLQPQEAATRAVKPIVMAAPRITVAQLALSDTLRCGRYTLLPALGGRLSAYVTHDIPTEWDESLCVTGPFGTIEIAQGRRLILGLTGIDPGAFADVTGDHRQWLQAAFAGRLADTPFADSDCLGTEVSDFSIDSLPLRLVLSTEQHRVETCARASITVWQEFFSRNAWEHEHAGLPVWPELSIQSTVTAARHTLPASMLKQLAAGDIILPDTPRFNADGEGLVTLGCRELRVQYCAPCTLKIIAVEAELSEEKFEEEANYEEPQEYAEGMGEDGTGSGEYAEGEYAEGEYAEGVNAEGVNAEGEYAEGEYAAEAAVEGEAYQEESYEEGAYEGEQGEAQAYEGEHETSAEGEAYAAEPAEGPETHGHDRDAMDNVPVVLHFELGKVSLPLGTLRTMGAGAVVLLDGGSPASIAIVSGGQTLGQGELVDVDGSLGIRVISWGAQS